jgi:hypothetical protein
MPREERRDVLARFRAGALDVVTNCHVLTEGFDEPRVDCILMARPTRSLLLYAQMVGRGTRKAKEKADLVVIDVADNSRKHSLAGLHRLFDLPDTLDLNGARALETTRAFRGLARRMPWIDLSRVRTPEELKVAAERIDLFRFDPPEAIAGATRFTWLPAPGGGFRLALTEGNAIVVQPTLLGDWEARVAGRTGEPVPIARAPDGAGAVQLADRFVLREFPQVVRLLRRDASWRDREPSEKQLQALRARRLPTPPGLTRGQASWMLAYAFGMRPGRRGPSA